MRDTSIGTRTIGDYSGAFVPKKKEEKRRTKWEGKIHEKICNTRREIDFYSNILRNQWDV